MEYTILCGSSIFFFFLLGYCMFFTRRTILRVFGWMIAIAIILTIFQISAPGGGAIDGAEAMKIVNDLRNLRGAAAMFREAHCRPPMPGDEASLDLYMDRPFITVESPRYARVMLSGERYVGVELRPESNGRKGILKKLASSAENIGLLGEVPSGGKTASLYKSGLNVYMEIPPD